MRFLHTADWHLGRLLHGERLTDDQSYVLDQVVELAEYERVDAVVISGDIYDRAVPPPEAVSLLDNTLSELAIRLELPVILIAGNHDSPERLAFGSRLLSQQRVHVISSLASAAQRITLRDEHGPVHFYAVPYAEPDVTRADLGCPEQLDHDGAMSGFLHKLRGGAAVPARSVLLAHAFVTGGAESESERPLVIGGAGTVDAAHFADFSYVALGHLHQPQTIGDERVQYAGSLMKYSFSEATQRKSVNLVSLDAAGVATVERIPLRPRRDVRCLTGLFADLLAAPPNETHDYLQITLLDEGPVFDPLHRLREVYPHVLHIQRPELAQSGSLRSGPADHRQMSEQDLFAGFFEQIGGTALTPAQEAALHSVLNRLRQKQREAAA